MKRENKIKSVKAWIYFKHGHGNFFAFGLSFLNTTIIWYRLVIQQHTVLKNMISHLWQFALMFAAVYIPISIIIGYLDYKKGTVPIAAQVNPYSKDMAKAIYYISRGENDKAEEVIKKWAQ